MNAGDVAAIECPCCKGTLYKQILVDGGNGRALWMREKGTTAIQNDAHGIFMKCPQCSKRIALEETAADPSGKGFLISQHQKCDHILP